MEILGHSQVLVGLLKAEIAGDNKQQLIIAAN